MANLTKAKRDEMLAFLNVKWGVVRAIGPQLYLSNTVWCEDATNRNVWKPIEVYGGICNVIY